MVDAERSARAIVAYEAKNGHVNWKLEDVVLQRDIKPDEVLVRMVATGICHSDIVFSMMLADQGGAEASVLGHEGSGYAEAVGSQVKHVKPGDLLLLSFASCGACKSSFASLAIVKECSIVNVSGLVKNDEELRMLSPMGCGFQTGFGTIDNLAEAKATDAVVVLGLGGVGLCGIMAAKRNKCHTIIGVDRFEERLALAKDLGATHVMSTSAKDFDLTKDIRDLTDSAGADIIMDTTGNEGLIKSGWEATANRGQMIILGVPPPDATLGVHLNSIMVTGKRLRGSIQGDVTPSVYIPKMIQWQKEGRLPIEKVIKYYRVEDFPQALDDMHKGSTIKPVLIW